MRATSEQEGGRRLALVIATSSYADPTLAKLRAPGRDAQDFAEVLADGTIGGFQVDTVLDAPADTVRRRVAQFCAQGDSRDLLLIYLSCHGVLDDRGRLYYATTDTDRALLSVTAVQAAWFNEHLEDCRCRRQVLVLDCCHSGAFAKGAKGDGALALRERFGARGRVVLTASRATEYSFEGNDAVGGGASSVFTGALVDGLRTGKADGDRDGLITVTELYDYAYQVVKASDAAQTPSLWSYGAEGSLLVAHSPQGAVIEPAPLPEDLISALESSRPQLRQGAVAGLADLLVGPDAGRALTAREVLGRVAADDIPVVAGAAKRVLDAHPPSAASGRPAKPAPPPAPEPEPEAPASRPPSPPDSPGHPPPGPRATLIGSLAQHKGRIALLAVALVAVIVAVKALGSDPQPRRNATASTTTTGANRTSRTISMRSIGATKVVATAELQVDEPPTNLVISLTPGGDRYQLLLFDRRADVESFFKVPESAFVVRGGGPRGELSTANGGTNGSTWTYAAGLPESFREYSHFGIVRLEGRRHRLVLYERFDRLGDLK